MKFKTVFFILLVCFPIAGYSLSYFPDSADLTKHGLFTISKWPKREKALSLANFLSKVGKVDSVEDASGFDELQGNLPYLRIELFHWLMKGKFNNEWQAKRCVLYLNEFPHPDSTGRLLKLTKSVDLRVSASMGLSAQALRVKWYRFSQDEVLEIRKLATDSDQLVAKYAKESIKRLKAQKSAK